MDTVRKAEVNSAFNRMQFRTNAKTGNYDVKYHRLEFEVDPLVAQIHGDVTIYFEAKSSLSQITFELSNNMTVSQILQHGKPLVFAQKSNDEVVIKLTQEQALGVWIP